MKATINFLKKSRKHKLVKKTNKYFLTLVSSMIEPFKKITTSTLGTFKWPKWQTWCGFPMTQIDEDFFRRMRWKFKNLAFGLNSSGTTYNISYPRYGTLALDLINDKVRIGPTTRVWILIACLDPCLQFNMFIIYHLYWYDLKGKAIMWEAACLIF